MTVTLRGLREDDLGTVRTWFEDAETRRWLGGPDWPEEALRLARAPDRHALLALDGDMPVGLVDLERYADGRASFAIAVDPARRGRGLGTAVVDAVLADPAMAGVTEAIAGIEAGNVASERLVQRCGFATVSEVDQDGFRYYARRRS